MTILGVAFYWCTNLILICIFVMSNNVEVFISIYLFTHLCIIFVEISGSLDHVLIGLPSYYRVMRVIILDTSSLEDIGVANIFCMLSNCPRTTC